MCGCLGRAPVPYRFRGLNLAGRFFLGAERRATMSGLGEIDPGPPPVAQLGSIKHFQAPTSSSTFSPREPQRQFRCVRGTQPPHTRKTPSGTGDPCRKPKDFCVTKLQLDHNPFWLLTHGLRNAALAYLKFAGLLDALSRYNERSARCLLPMQRHRRA